MTRGIFVIGTTIMIAAGVTIFGQATSQPESDLINDLVIANRVMASNYMDVLGVYGHISARSRRSDDRFYLSRNVAPALVTAADIREHDLEGNRIGADRSDQDEERFIGWGGNRRCS